MENEVAAVVIDNGSGFIKAGFSGDDAPCAVLPSVVGRPGHQVRGQLCVSAAKERRRAADGLQGAAGGQDRFIGAEALSRRDQLTMKNPIERGAVVSWDDMEAVRRRCRSGIISSSCGSSAASGPADRGAAQPQSEPEKTTQVMFEAFGCPALALALQPVLSMYSTGRTTGMVMESGDGCSHAVPVYQGYALPQAVLRLDLGGADLTEHLMKLLSSRGFSCAGQREVVEDMKQKLCFVALDFDQEVKTAAESSCLDKTYKLPDGREVSIGEERIRCPEALLKPQLIEMAPSGLHELIHSSIMKCELDVRRNLFSTILLSGGSTLFPGLSDRMKKEISQLAPPATKVQILAPAERQFSVWNGGSILASLPSFQQMCISQQEYQESGPGIVHRKCF